MLRSSFARSLSGGVLLLAMSRPAWPCSIATPDVFPILDGRAFAAAPLLFSVEAAPTLRRTDVDPPTEVPLVPAPRPELGELRDPYRGQVQAFRATASLAVGSYQLDGQTFRIEPTGEPVDHIPGSTGTPALAIDVDRGSDCGVSTFTVTTGSEDGEQYLLIARTPTVESRQLAMTRSGHLTLLTLDGIDFTEERFCVELQGMALDGTLGAPLDLGCIDPTDGSDPRVTRPGPFGCSTGPGPAGLVPLAIVLFVGLLRRRR